MIKTIATLCALGAFSIAAAAQSAPPPTGPTDVQCQQGWKEGMAWTRDQFTAACQKLREGKRN